MHNKIVSIMNNIVLKMTGFKTYLDFNFDKPELFWDVNTLYQLMRNTAAFKAHNALLSVSET